MMIIIIFYSVIIMKKFILKCLTFGTCKSEQFETSLRPEVKETFSLNLFSI